MLLWLKALVLINILGGVDDVVIYSWRVVGWFLEGEDVDLLLGRTGCAEEISGWIELGYGKADDLG